ncbi:hypothetical protein Poly41_16530 [Novipirellula artificiosorum]|uniref:Peptidase C39 domain-containing protein n=1 Tax=Novipirellula artificiosorum TaxID=2528016 RepID=A0A5C6DVY0_9BACT|nr:hypothetical protein Poly41_16530 [Novipirellula artificiosorum]
MNMLMKIGFLALLSTEVPVVGATVEHVSDFMRLPKSGVQYHVAQPRDPICGLLCVRASISALGKNAPGFETLVRKRYLSSESGSTVDDLCNAISDHDLTPHPFSSLSTRALSGVKRPVILHVRNKLDRTKFGHWVLYEGFTGKGFVIQDFPSEPVVMHHAELASIWDGTGIVVEDAGEAASGSYRFSIAWISSYAIVLAIVVICFLLSTILVRIARLADRSSTAKHLTESGLIFVMLVFSFHVLRSDGFFRRSRSYQRYWQCTNVLRHLNYHTPSSSPIARPTMCLLIAECQRVSNVAIFVMR